MSEQKKPAPGNAMSAAAFKEYMAQHRTERGTGETNLEFPEWLKQAYPTMYPKWLTATGQGK